MDDLQTILASACEDQRDALRAFRLTGSADDASRVHYESCLACERALDAIATMRASLVPVPSTAIQGNRPGVVAMYLGTCVAGIGLVGFLVYLLVGAVIVGREESVSELEDLERRVQFVRMPGRPDVCVAALRGVGGFGPTFMGSAKCADVSDRYASDEEISWALRDYVVTRIRGTDVCLAHAHGDPQSFTLPCGEDD